MSTRRLALKVDCDTYEGTKKGIPNLLQLFDEFKIRASFFFTLGPDTSGRAVFRVFTQKGFLKKMLRSNAAALYGPKTMMYGTLLPSPMIGTKCTDEIRSVAGHGHDIGVHGWDHIRWHDRLDKMSSDAILRDVTRAHAMFEEIFSQRAHSQAAPGWHATAASFRLHAERELLYVSDTRGGSPCFVETDGQRFPTLEIPTTLPTWDEMLGDPALREEANFIAYYRNAVRGTEVHSIHTEVEGTAHLDLFHRQLEEWKADGVEFVTLEDIAREQLKNKSKIPVRQLRRVEIPNRGGLVSSTV